MSSDPAPVDGSVNPVESVGPARPVEPVSPVEPVGSARPVGPWSYPRRVLTRPEKYERLAFTFCRMGSVGLIAWAIGPAWFVLISALTAVVLYGRAISLGVGWTKCFLRRPTYIVGFWLVVAAVDAYWLLVLGERLPG